MPCVLEGMGTKPTSVWQGIQAKHVIEFAIGYKRLGLLDEARAECETVSQDDDYWQQAQEQLLIIDLFQERMSEAADRGAALIANGSPGAHVVLTTAMALHQSGNSRKAYDILMAYHQMFVGDSEAAYTFACYGAAIGEVDFAIRELLVNYRSSKRYWKKSCIDPDLEPIWIKGATGNISLDSSLALAHPLMSEVIETSRAFQGEIPIDCIIKSQMPQGCRDYLRVHPATGFFTLDRRTPSQIRDRYLDWQRDYKARTFRLVERAIQMARDVVLDHQLDWAVEKAKVGHLLGARHHVIFGLAYRPGRLCHYAQVLRPLGLQYFFEELAHAELINPGFCLKLHLLNIARDSGDIAGALNLLEGIPATLHSLTVCLLQRANVEQCRGNRHFATRLYREIARRWPQDPAGYYNAIANLMKEEKWDMARQLFDQAPKSYRILVLSQMQCTQLENKDSDGESIKTEVFYGQPEWDERFKIIAQIKE